MDYLQDTKNINILLRELEILEQELLFIGKDDKRYQNILLKIEILNTKIDSIINKNKKSTPTPS